jgi:hypothetical protein
LVSYPCLPPRRCTPRNTFPIFLELSTDDSFFGFTTFAFTGFTSRRAFCRTQPASSCYSKTVFLERDIVPSSRLAARDVGTDKPGRAGRGPRFLLAVDWPAPNKSQMLHAEKQKQNEYLVDVLHTFRTSDKVDGRRPRHSTGV